MTELSQVLETKYTLTEVLDYTDARVRVDGKDVWIRVNGRKNRAKDVPFLIAEAEEQARG